MYCGILSSVKDDLNTVCVENMIMLPHNNAKFLDKNIQLVNGYIKFAHASHLFETGAPKSGLPLYNTQITCP